MSATRPGTGRAWRRNRQAGVAAVEFALLAIIFFMLIFGIIELARAMYIFGTVQEVTRHAAGAAALTSHRDGAALKAIQLRAIFRDTPGELVLGAPITDRNVRIDYLALVRDADGDLSMRKIDDASLPTCPRHNREICLANPNADNCIRFVRARICSEDTGTECGTLPYQPIVPLIPLPIQIPRATTISVVESFGSMPEGTPCL